MNFREACQKINKQIWYKPKKTKKIKKYDNRKNEKITHILLFCVSSSVLSVITYMMISFVPHGLRNSYYVTNSWGYAQVILITICILLFFASGLIIYQNYKRCVEK